MGLVLVGRVVEEHEICYSTGLECTPVCGKVFIGSAGSMVSGILHQAVGDSDWH